MIIVAMHPTDDTQLARVQEEMQRLGPPTIRVVRADRPGLYLAVEGTHRLAAAAALGHRPQFEVLRAILGTSSNSTKGARARG